MKEFLGGLFPLNSSSHDPEAGINLSSQATYPSNGDSVLLAQFLQSLVDRKASQRTITAYNHDIQKFIESCGQNVAVLKPEDIERHIEGLAQTGAKFSTVKRTLSAVREFFSFLVDHGDIEQNPAGKVKITSVPQNVLSAENVITLFQYIAERQRSQNSAIALRYRRDELILLLMIFYGVRQYQIPFLKLSAIERNEQLFALRVNDRLSVKFSGEMLNKLWEYLSLRNSNSDTIFLDPLDGLPISVSAVHSLLRELNYRVAIRCSSSSLYHTFLQLHNDPEGKQELLSSICSSDRQCGLPQSIVPRGVMVHA